jgi:hypothetical protein
MKSTLPLLILATALPLSSPAMATKEDSQVWTTGNVTVKLSDRWRIQDEIVGRFSDNRHGLYEIENNLLLGYQLSKKVSLWAGYTHDPQYAGGDFTIMEHRAREQAVFSKIAQFAGGSLDARLRFEERWRDGLDGTGVRFRPYVKFTLPFKKGGKTALVISHESFINLNTTTFQKQSGYERMRNLIAISTPLTKNVSAEIGYLNQYGAVRGGEDTMDHTTSIALYASF